MVGRLETMERQGQLRPESQIEFSQQPYIHRGSDKHFDI